MTSTFYDENIIDHYHTRICNEKKFACSFQPFQYEIRLSCPHQMYQDNVIQPTLGLLLVERAPTVHNVQFVKYDVTVSFMAQVLDTVTYLVPQVLDTAS